MSRRKLAVLMPVCPREPLHSPSPRPSCYPPTWLVSCCLPFSLAMPLNFSQTALEGSEVLMPTHNGYTSSPKTLASFPATSRPTPLVQRKAGGKLVKLWMNQVQGLQSSSLWGLWSFKRSESRDATSR